MIYEHENSIKVDNLFQYVITICLTDSSDFGSMLTIVHNMDAELIIERGWLSNFFCLIKITLLNSNNGEYPYEI